MVVVLMVALVRDQRKLIGMVLAVFAVVLAWSANQPHDWFTWVLEAAPALLGLVILASTYRRFRFTNLVYLLIGGHAVILLIGAHYTYAEVPAFNWLRDQYHLSRNHYDRLGHLAQGFVPAMIVREILLRTASIRRGALLIVLVLLICLGISAAYELFEWIVARATGAAADAFLGSQGDPWDTQWDMACALIGASISLLLLSPIHDRQLARASRQNDLR